jgi:hypothetical protein
MLELGFTVHLSAGAVKLLHDVTSDPRPDLLETASHAMYVAKRLEEYRLFTTVAVGHAGNGREARVLLANEPCSYREALRLRPDLVVCDRVTPRWRPSHAPG